MNWMRGEGEREESGMTPSFRPEQLEGLRCNYLRWHRLQWQQVFCGEDQDPALER